jgi:hypothetical protein
MSERSDNRVAIVCDEKGNWFVRHIRTVVHDGEKDEYIYYCDKPISQKFVALDGAVRVAKRWLKMRQRDRST